MAASIQPVIDLLRQRDAEWIEVLKKSVAIKSVSASPALRPQVRCMADFIVSQFKEIIPDIKIWLQEIAGPQHHSSGIDLEFPPLVLCETPMDPKKKTLLIYAHYDVQPADKTDGWDTEPFELTVINEEMRGRGTTDDKGPLIGWLNVLRCYKDTGCDLPVNLKFIMEGMEESGSLGFDETAMKIRKTTDFFNNVDYCCVSDNYWVTTEKPCLSYGLRGLTTCELEITGPSADMHSGSCGGLVHQPMDDLIYIISQLKDNDENILIPNVCDTVAPITPEESALYDAITFSTESKSKELGVNIRNKDSKSKALMAIWRYPALTIHGIEGAFSESGFKTVIPRRVVGKFSIRLVPNQKGDDIEKAVEDYIKKLWSQRTTGNRYNLKMHSGRWFYIDPLKSDVFKAAANAIQIVHSDTPDYTREGGSIPITLTLSELTGKDLCLLPMGRADDGAHAQNEKLDLFNYRKGMEYWLPLEVKKTRNKNVLQIDWITQPSSLGTEDKATGDLPFFAFDELSFPGLDSAEIYDTVNNQGETSATNILVQSLAASAISRANAYLVRDWLGAAAIKWSQSTLLQCPRLDAFHLHRAVAFLALERLVENHDFSFQTYIAPAQRYMLFTTTIPCIPRNRLLVLAQHIWTRSFEGSVDPVSRAYAVALTQRALKASSYKAHSIPTRIAPPTGEYLYQEAPRRTGLREEDLKDEKGLEQECWEYSKEIGESVEERAKREDFTKCLKKAVGELIGIEPHLYGSAMTGLRDKDSDVDLGVRMCELPPNSWLFGASPQKCANYLLDGLSNMSSPHSFSTELGQAAHKPLLKIIDPKTGLQADIVIVAEDLAGVRNSSLLYHYCKMDSRVLPLVSIIKHWSRQRNINGSYQGFISSFAYTLSVVFFLQCCQPPVLPNLQMSTSLFKDHPHLLASIRESIILEDSEQEFLALNPKRVHDPSLPWRSWRSRNSCGLYQLLIQYFSFYTFDFPWCDRLVSCRSAPIECSILNFFSNTNNLDRSNKRQARSNSSTSTLSLWLYANENHSIHNLLHGSQASFTFRAHLTIEDPCEQNRLLQPHKTRGNTEISAEFFRGWLLLGAGLGIRALCKPLSDSLSISSRNWEDEEQVRLNYKKRCSVWADAEKEGLWPSHVSRGKEAGNEKLAFSCRQGSNRRCRLKDLRTMTGWDAQRAGISFFLAESMSSSSSSLSSSSSSA